MTCTRVGNAIVCNSSSYGRLHVGNRYIYVDFHRYCGPSFSFDADGMKPYEPKDENDPVWAVFGNWLDKQKAKVTP